MSRARETVRAAHGLLRSLVRLVRDVLAMWLIEAAVACATPAFGRDIVRSIIPALECRVDRARVAQGKAPRYSR